MQYLLLIHDESGKTGVGESWINFPNWAPWERIAAFERTLIPYLRGKQIADIASFMKSIDNDFRRCGTSRSVAGVDSGSIGRPVREGRRLVPGAWEARSRRASRAFGFENR